MTIRLALTLSIYNLLLPPALLVMLPGYLRKQHRRGGGKGGFAQRLGRYDAGVTRRLRDPQDFWVHAVSVGEVNVATKLIAALLAERPALQIVLTTTTTTGFDVARRALPAGVTVLFSPVDLPWVVRRALRLIRPRQIVLIEAEVWPNLVAAAHRGGVTVSLVNARMSPRSGRRFRRFAPLVAPVFSLLDRVLVQEPADLDRWVAVGARPEATRVVGSLKFDQDGAEQPAAPDRFRVLLDSIWESTPGRVVLLAASTHSGEESLLVSVYRSLLGAHPDLRLVLVPRHFERAGEVESALRHSAPGVRVVRRTGLPAATPDDGAVLLVDTTGELGGWTCLADLAVIGKSFRGRGGQNPVEAVAAGVPVVFGPHMENFLPLADQLVAAGGARQTDEAGLTAALAELLESPDSRHRLASNARGVLEAHAGACRRVAGSSWGDR